jgi:hypothetical protein
MMKIVDINANPIRACFTFNCDGFEVSCTTITVPAEVVVFRRRRDGAGMAMYRATCVADAIDWCRANQDKI